VTSLNVEIEVKIDI